MILYSSIDIFFQQMEDPTVEKEVFFESITDKTIDVSYGPEILI